MTQWVADLVGAEIGSTIDLDGVERTVVGIVENPNDLDDDFVLAAPSELAHVRRRWRCSSTPTTNASTRSGHRVRHGRTVSARGDVREDVIAAVARARRDHAGVVPRGARSRRRASPSSPNGGCRSSA